MKRKIAVILAADIAGYSRLMADDEEETLRRFEGYRTVFSEFVARGGGRIFNTAGDAILAEFQSAVEAVRCAVDIQESLHARNLAYPPSRHMNFRIGITIGDVVEREGGDLLGDGVNIAARLESVAPPGGVCVSRSVHEAVASKMTLRFDDAGPQSLKNMPERVHAFTIALAGTEPDVVIMQPGVAAAAPAARPAQQHWATAGLAVLALAVVGIYAYKYLPASGPETPEPQSVSNNEPSSNNGASPATGGQPSPAPPARAPETTPQPPEPAKSEPANPEPTKRVDTATAPDTAPSAGTQAPRSSTNPLTTRYVLTRLWTDCHESDKSDLAADACKGLLDNGGLDDPDRATILYKFGRALREKGEPDKAIESYDQSIELAPTSDAYNHRGVAYFDKGNFGRAINDYTEAIRLSPSSADAINNRAWTYFKAGNLAAALQDANRAVALDGSKAYIWDTRGHINEANGNRSAAISDYRKALNLDSSTESSAEGLQRLGAN